MAKAKIEGRIETLQDISARIGGLLQGIQAARDTGAQEIEDNGEISQETCMSMATLMSSLHEDSRKLYIGGYSIHQSMSKYIPEGGNEGQKPWPP